MIGVGQKFPEFELQGVNEDNEIGVIADHDIMGWAVIYFYPKDFTFVCPTELFAFQNKLSEFEDRGVEVVAPFYTHLDKNDKPCGVLVSRGWIPWDLQHVKLDQATSRSKVQGVLYTGDTKTREMKKNVAMNGDNWTVLPEELAITFKMNNEDEASKFMLKMIDYDEDNRTAMPDVPSPKELSKFDIAPERHEAYEKLWNSAIYLGVVANTVMWLYL